VYSPFETIATETGGTGSPTPRSETSRRTSRRWAATSSPKRDDEDARSLCTTLEPDLPHVVETLVAALLDPPDLDQRVRDYDWYIHYQDDEVLATGSTAEPQDLQLYVRAAQLASGAEPDETSPAALPGRVDAYEVPKQSLTYYENWLHAE
jgi:hypothetical protein